MARLLALAALVGLLALPAAPALAQGQGNPFGPLPQTPPEQPAPEPALPDGTADEEEGFETWQQLLVLLGALTLIGAIAFAIFGDARRRASVGGRRSGRGTEPIHQGPGGHRRETARERERRRRQARARTKAQRRARKKNR